MSKHVPLEKIYPSCRSLLSEDLWEKLIALVDQDFTPESFPKLLMLEKDPLKLPAYMPELASLEWAVHQVQINDIEIPVETDRPSVNPSLQLLELSWKNIPLLIGGDADKSKVNLEAGHEFVLVWRHPETGETRCRAASEEELLALKIVVENCDPREAAKEGNVAVGVIDTALRRARHRGILIPLRPRIRREEESFPIQGVEERFLTSDVFTLQWHITQTCDLHCKHCYDRSKRSTLKLEQGIAILDDLRDFCAAHSVGGQISFTGGNPLLYPHFLELYQEAADRDLALAILGNPADRETIEGLLAIEHPVFYQVSLEGLEEHNDMIRGAGHFGRVFDFLEVLKELGVFSMVMLTLTKDNMGQVLPLAELLRDKTDLFTFNRLSPVGEGASLQAVSPAEYPAFLEAYLEAAQHNPAMGLKDNLFNIIRHQQGNALFGGCAGYGCGAAFNFISVLADGEVHACRKLPSLIGNIFEQSINDIYESEMARRYRAGSASCRDCKIRPVCGGCLAVCYGTGLDVFKDKDPYCFMESV